MLPDLAELEYLVFLFAVYHHFSQYYTFALEQTVRRTDTKSLSNGFMYGSAVLSGVLSILGENLNIVR